METLQHASFEQTGKIETVTRSAVDLSNALVGTDAYERISRENQRHIDELARRCAFLQFISFGPKNLINSLKSLFFA